MGWFEGILFGFASRIGGLGILRIKRIFLIFPPSAILHKNQNTVAVRPPKIRLIRKIPSPPICEAKQNKIPSPQNSTL